jgi:hypothetical protein
MSATGRAAREVVHRPTPALDPSFAGVRLGVGLHRRDGVRGIRRLGQVAQEQLDAGTHRVHVGVLEPGAQQRSVEIDHAGGLADQVGRGRFGYDRRHTTVRHGDGVPAQGLAVSGEHGTADEQYVCRH